MAKAKTELYLSDYAKTHHLNEAAVKRATARAFACVTGYERSVAASQGATLDATIKTTEANKTRFETQFRNLVTADPRLVDFDAVMQRMVPDTIRRGNAMKEENRSLMQTLASSEYDTRPLLKILIEEGKHSINPSPPSATKRDFSRSFSRPQTLTTGGPCLVLAIEHGNYDIAKWLLEHGAKPNGDWPHVSNRSSKALSQAISRQTDRPEFVHLLCDHGVIPGELDINHAILGQRIPSLDALVERKFLGPGSGTYHQSLCAIAAGGASPESLRWLLQQGYVPGPATLPMPEDPGKVTSGWGKRNYEKGCEAVALYNQTLEEQKTKWQEKLDAYARGETSEWNPANATADDIARLYVLGIYTATLTPEYWHGAEAHAVRLIDTLPHDIQASLMIQREALQAFATPDAQIQSATRNGSVTPPPTRTKDE